MTALDLIQRRWAAQVVLALGAGPLRYNALLRSVPGISDRLLTGRLRDLEEARPRLVYRRVEIDSPIRIFYGLTTDGLLLLSPLRDLVAAAGPKELVG